MPISEWSEVADQNTTISGINIAEGCPPGGINDAIRQMMADVKTAVGELDAAIAEAVRKSIPAGSVLPFYRVSLGGTENRNPIFWGQSEPDTGWLICDGGSDGQGGTVPDLRNKFIQGASDTDDAGQTGGAASATPTVTVTGSSSQISIGATTLSVAQLASHSHTVTTTQYPASGDFGSGSNKATVQTNSGMTGGSQAHTHSATLDKLSLSAIASDVPTLPPFYRLVHCVKLPAS